MKNNQDGVSLVEVLAILVLTSIVLILAWSIFFQGTNYSNKSITKSFMQQEANIIVTKFKKIHQTSDSYELDIESCSFEVSYQEVGIATPVVEVFKHDDLCIELSGISSAVTIHPKDSSLNNSSIAFQLILKDKENQEDETKQVQIKATLHRLPEK